MWLGDRDAWREISNSIMRSQEKMDPGDTVAPSARALGEAADFIRMHGHVPDEAATWEAGGRVTALWRAGHRCAAVRFPGNGEVDWIIFADRIVVGKGKPEDSLRDMGEHPGMGPVLGFPGRAPRRPARAPHGKACGVKNSVSEVSSKARR